MHTLTTRMGRIAVLLAFTATTVGVVVLGAEPAAAAPCGRGCSHDGNATGAGYSAAAAYVTATGAGSTSSDNSCTLQGREAAMPEDAPPVEGHLEVHSYGGPDTYSVFVDCIENGHTGITGDQLWDVLEVYENVPALEPEELVEEALAHMPIGSPTIQTSPGDGNPTLVGIDTWLMIDEGSWAYGERTDSQGPISVRVWAEPDDDGEVLWDTGEGTKTCIGSGRDPEGSCFWPYNRSSAGQPGVDGAGRPSYAVTASVSYTGGYEVTAFGIPVGGDSDLGDISRTSAPYFLAVDEAQSLNTGD
ncbi:MAG: hypothetical protein ACRD2C_04755 [Acidimicrobiales bacterium]